MLCIPAALTIRYSWGAGDAGQNVAGSQNFSTSYEYDTSISITTAGIFGINKGVRANLKGSFAGRKITASLGIDLCNNAPSSSSCASQDSSVVTGTDLTGTRTHQLIHLWSAHFILLLLRLAAISWRANACRCDVNCIIPFMAHFSNVFSQNSALFSFFVEYPRFFHHLRQQLSRPELLELQWCLQHLPSRHHFAGWLLRY